MTLQGLANLTYIGYCGVLVGIIIATFCPWKWATPIGCFIGIVSAIVMLKAYLKTKEDASNEANDS